jgi:hypothetical protein
MRSRGRVLRIVNVHSFEMFFGPQIRYIFLAESVTVEVLITETFENSLHFIVTLIFAEMQQLSCLSLAKKYVHVKSSICRVKLTYL